MSVDSNRVDVRGVNKPHGLTGRPSGRRHTSENFEQRFWEKVDRRGPDDCWPWTGSTNGREGRGRVHLGYKGDSKLRKRIYAYAYVVSWQFANGPVPTGLCVLHRCDNGKCVNPAHLFIGTQADNVRDMHAKGRADSYGQKKELASGVHINRRRGERLQAA